MQQKLDAIMLYKQGINGNIQQMIQTLGMGVIYHTRHFVDSIRTMNNMGIHHFICVGPQRNLSVFVRNTLKGIDNRLKIDTITTLDDINQLML